MGLGHLDAEVVFATGPSERGVNLCIEIDAGPKYKIERVEFRGNRIVPDAQLMRLLDRTAGSFNRKGKPPRMDLMDEVTPYLTALFFEYGLLNASVTAELHKRSNNASAVLEFSVVEGRQFHVGTVTFTGQLVAPRDVYQERFGATAGALFVRSEHFAPSNRT